ncbi:MAG: DMT family transporter [Candidatus Binatia bacterium]
MPLLPHSSTLHSVPFWGGLPLLAVAFFMGKFLPPSRSWGWLLTLGVTNTTLGLAGMFLSVGAIGAAIPGVVANIQALFVAPFAALFFGEALTRNRVAGLLLGTAGVALIILGSGTDLGDMDGASLGLMATVGLTTGNLVIKHIGSWVDALTATAWQYVLGGLMVLGSSLMIEDTSKVVWSPHFVAGLLFLGLVGSALASWVWYRLVSKGELISLNGLTLLTPAFALVLALLIFREPVSTLSMLGIAMVLGGVAWVGWTVRPEPVKAETC